MPVPSQVPNLGSSERCFNLQRLKNDAHEFKVPINCTLMPCEFVDSALYTFKRLNLAHLVFFRATLKKRRPIVNGKSLDSEAQLKRRIGERRGVFAFGADLEPGTTLGDVVREARLMTGGDLLLCHARPNARGKLRRSEAEGTNKQGLSVSA